MEISSADYFTFTQFSVCCYENQRIVCRAVQFNGDCRAYLRERVARGAVNLRSATQAVRILDARVFFRSAMRFANGAALIQAPQIFCGNGVTGVRADARNTLVEGCRAAAQRVQGEGGGYVGGV